MSTITRIDFAENLRSKFGLTSTDSYKLIDLIFSEISFSLIRGEEVKIAGLGSFKILKKTSRIGRNPKTGKSAIISARQVVSFRPSTEFRKKISIKD